MAVTSTGEGSSSDPKLSGPKRTKCPGVRVIRGLIYDSENGRSCHQCRQKTRSFSAACKNQKGNKQCTINFCHKCLLNRYGEKAEDVALLDDWKCPKCRGICNCSQCMKKRGYKPTGQMVHAAKATGFSSVSEMLQVRGPDSSNHKNTAEEMVASVKESLSPKKESMDDSFMKLGKENSFDGNCNSNLNSQNLAPILDDRKSKQNKHEGLKEISNSNGDVYISLRKKTPKDPKITEEITMTENDTTYGNDKKDFLTNEKEGGNFVEKKKSKMRASKNDYENVKEPNGIENMNAGPKVKAVRKFPADIELPQGANLTTIAGIEIAPKDVGHALQFIEFCSAFGEVLDLKKGQAEYILRELIRGRIRRKGQLCPIVQIHIQLLSLIQEDMGEKSPSLSSTSGKDSWLQVLGKCISESKCSISDIPSDCFNSGGDGYDKLDCSKKLELLNFLCDEALSTKVLRSWIEDRNSKFVESGKKAKEKVVAAKDKEKQLKRQLQDEVAKAIIVKNGAPLSIAEHETLISTIKSEATQAHSEMLEAMGMLPKRRQRSDAVRTEPILVEDNGRAFWRLKGYTDEPHILLQDLQGDWDANALTEKWVVYNAEQKPAIEKYISISSKKPRVENVTDYPKMEVSETDS